MVLHDPEYMTPLSTEPSGKFDLLKNKDRDGESFTKTNFIDALENNYKNSLPKDKFSTLSTSRPIFVS